MIDVLFVFLALAVAAVVIFAWHRVHREHVEARAAQAEEAARRAEAVKRAAAVAAREPGPLPSAVRPPVEWAVPEPAKPPRPMYWPALLAAGIVWSAWGAISSPILIFTGLAIVIIALTLWIREMLHAS